MIESLWLGFCSLLWIVYAQFEKTPTEHDIDVAVASIGIFIAVATYYILIELRKGPRP